MLLYWHKSVTILEKQYFRVLFRFAVLSFLPALHLCCWYYFLLTDYAC